MAVEAVLGAAVQVLLQNLLSASYDEIKLTLGCKKEITKLQESLILVQKFLFDAEKKEINEGSVKEWLLRLEDVAFEADAVLDEFSYELFRQKLKNQNRKKGKVLSFSSGFPNLLFGRKMAHKIINLNEKLEKINRDAASYGLQMAVANSHVADSKSRQMRTDSFSEEPNFVGRENDVGELVEMLVTAQPNETFHVIPILGMGGRGKTTLARKVFNHEKIEAHFGIKIWVCVAVDFEAETLFKMILESLTGDSVQGFMTKQVVLEKIKNIVEKKRYLLVLDDIWSEDLNKWEDMISSLSGITSERGNGIVVTTRKEAIAVNVKTLVPHQLHNLSENDCWSIIKAKALLGVNDPEEFERTGKLIAQRCGGLPLAARVIGAFLRGKAEDEWCNLLQSQSLDFGDNENLVTKILRLSYDHLPSSSLKKCFAYCSVFPPHYMIHRTYTMRLWMAEGFLQGDERNNMEVVGDRYFEHLVQSSLFQDVKRDDFGKIISCRMHNFVHDLASSISGSGSIHEGNKQSKNLQCVRYLLQDSVDANFISKEKAKSLRSFFLIGTVAPDFSGFSYLHALTLVNSDLEVLPVEIEILIHLRLLDVKETSIKCMPDSICKLFNLQTLYASKDAEKFPYALIDIISLRHLVFPPMELPPGIGRLTSLQTLPCYKVGSEKGCRIGELRDLENLKGELQIQNLERVENKAEAEHANLSSKGLNTLNLNWSEVREGETNDENVLEGIQPHPGLKVLEIHGYKGQHFPPWTMRMAVQKGIDSCWVKLKYAIRIRLVNCRRCVEIPMLGHLPHLKFLELRDLPNLRSIGLSFYGSDENSSNTSTKISFPSLERLQLNNMPNLIDWVDVEGEGVVFPCLSYMEIKSCQQLKIVPSQFPRLEELHLEKLNGDFPLTNVCGNTRSLWKLCIGELPGLAHLPEELFVNNGSIWHLQICGCPKLTRLVPCLLGGGASLGELEVNDCESFSELPDDLDNLHSLQMLEIKCCPKLKSIPGVREESQGLISLRELRIFQCRELSNLPGELLESCATTLYELMLSGLDNLELASVISCLPRMMCLSTLDLYDLPKLITFPTTDVISCLRNLRELGIGGYSESIDEVSFTDNLNRILQDEHQDLEGLGLIGKEDWEFPFLVDTRNLTNLKTLAFWDFSYEALPEWVGNISSLQELRIIYCKTLKHMPSLEAMQRLTRLSVLTIKYCPLMKQSLTTDDGSEWAKISHIKQVEIDERPFTRDLPVQVQHKSQAPVPVQNKNRCCLPLPSRNTGGSSLS